MTNLFDKYFQAIMESVSPANTIEKAVKEIQNKLSKYGVNLQNINKQLQNCQSLKTCEKFRYAFEEVSIEFFEFYKEHKSIIMDSSHDELSSVSDIIFNLIKLNAPSLYRQMNPMNTQQP
jgi:hypothetical protein